MSDPNKNKLYVIGANDYYQFGLGHKDKLKELTEWGDESNPISVARVNTSLAGLIITDSNGDLWSMGCNQHGECAIPLAEDQSKDKSKPQRYITKPSQIKFFSDHNTTVSKIFANPNGWSVFWLTDANEVYGNGYNEFHQLGVGDTAHKFVPTPISSLKKIVKMTSADRYSLALDTNGLVFSTTHSVYGGNVHGSVKSKEDGIDIPQTYDWKRVQSLARIVDIDNGDEHSLFLSADGIIYGVGRGDNLRLGRPVYGVNQTISPIPFFKSNKILVTRIACGRAHNLCFDNHGKVWSWGCNFSGQCGDNTSSICAPKLVSTLSEEVVIDIKCGTDHSYVRTAKQQHFLFGSNQYNECSLMDVGALTISLPHSINHVIKNETNGEVKEVYLGSNSTMVVVSEAPPRANGKDEADEVLADLQNEKILELEETLSSNQVSIVALNKDLANKKVEIAKLNNELKDSQNKYLQYVKRIASDQEKHKKQAELQRKVQEGLQAELRKERELVKQMESESKSQAPTVAAPAVDDTDTDAPAKLLRKWKLDQYITILVEEMGYDVIDDWKELSMDELTGELQFKQGHAKRFIRKMNELFKK